MAITQVTDISNCIGAYSVRKIVAAYAGNCLRLRRSSDSAESDFGFSAGVLDTAAIATWLGADTGYVTTWYDQSGNGNNATQTDTTKQPVYVASGINSLPTIDLDGSNDFLAANGLAASFSGDSKAMSVSVMCRPTIGGVNEYTIFSISRSASANPYHINTINSSYLLYWQRRGDDNVFQAAQAGINTLSSGADYILASTYGKEGGDATGPGTLYVNGTNDDPIAAITETCTIDYFSIGILRLAANFYSPFDGYMSEVVVYANRLTAPEMRDLFEYQNAAFDIVAAARASADNAAAYLTTPTYDASGQAIHPDVIDMVIRLGPGQTWNGKRYWMAMTPYTSSSSAVENPSILCSNDGSTWTVPAGLTNPIDGPPATGDYGDVDLLLAQDDDLYCYWLWNDAGGVDRLMESHSSDGVNWSAPTQMLTSSTETYGSPCVIWDGSQYVLYYTDLLVSPYKIRRRTSNSPGGGWSASSECTFPARGIRGIWDFNITYDETDNTYHAFVCYRKPATYSDVLFYGTSEDGLTFTMDEYALLNTSTGVVS